MYNITYHYQVEGIKLLVCVQQAAEVRVMHHALLRAEIANMKHGTLILLGGDTQSNATQHNIIKSNNGNKENVVCGGSHTTNQKPHALHLYLWAPKVDHYGTWTVVRI